MADNLGTPDVAASQTQKEVTINAAKNQIAGALSDYLSVDLSSADHTLTATEFTGFMGFATSGNAVSRTLTIPATKRAIFYVENGGTASLSVTRGSTTLVIAAGAVAFLQTDGTTNGLISVAPLPIGVELDIGVAFSGKPLASQAVNIPMNQAVSLPASLTGSHFFVGTNPTSTMTFTINKNGSSVGTVAFGTSGTPTVTFASPVSFAVGDVLNITAPNPQDLTGSDVGLNFKSTRN